MLGELVQRGSCWYKLCPTLRCCFIVVCACDFLVFKLFSNGQVRLKKKDKQWIVSSLHHRCIKLSHNISGFQKYQQKRLKTALVICKSKGENSMWKKWSGLGTMADRQFAQCTHLNVMWILLVFIASLKTLTQSDFHLVGFYVSVFN